MEAAGSVSAGRLASAGSIQAALAGAAPDRLSAIAFASPARGYGVFTGQAGGRCQALVGRTTDGGARFGSLAQATSWRCGDNPPASSLAADSHGDVFLYGPGLFASHDGGQTWAASHQPGTVLAISAAGRSVWMVRADCGRAAHVSGHSCALRLLESANGGRAWAPSPTQPPGATVRTVGGVPALESATGQTWLLRTSRSSAYLLSNHGRKGEAPLWFTADAGRTWSRRQVQCGKIGVLSVTASAAPDGTLLAVCAGQPSAGYQAKSAARSADGGRSWTVHAACPPPHMYCRGGTLDFGYLGQIDAVSANTVFLAGPRSSLLRTNDGGIHWRPVRPLIGDSGGGTSQVIFVNRRDGIVLGNDSRNNELPTIWHTSNGGAHWSKVTPRGG